VAGAAGEIADVGESFEAVGEAISCAGEISPPARRPRLRPDELAAGSSPARASVLPGVLVVAEEHELEARASAPVGVGGAELACGFGEQVHPCVAALDQRSSAM